MPDPTTLPNNSPEKTSSVFSSQDVTSAIENFKLTGQVDQNIANYAKQKLLPNLGFSQNQITDLGATAVMVELKKAQEEGKLGSTPQTFNNKSSINSSSLPFGISQEEIVKQIETEIQNQVKTQNFPSSSQSNAEVLTNATDINPQKSLNQNQMTDQNTDNQVQKEKTNEAAPILTSNQINGTASEEPSQEPNFSADPLNQSVNLALERLSEGTAVGKEWTVQKIFTTSFGNTKSSFYELRNKVGATWTLSREEMKDLLRGEILARNQENTEKEKESTPPLQAIQTPEQITITKTEANVTPKEPNLGDETAKPSKEENLTDEQLNMLRKLHEDKETWRTFLTLRSEQLEKFKQLYSRGQLSTLGLAFNPLLDKLRDENFGEQVELHKDDNFVKILEKKGHKITWSAQDALLFGSHALVNYKILHLTHEKIASQGISSEPLPKETEVVELIKLASSGDGGALHKLQESLNLLPANEKLRILKPEEIEELKQFLS